MTIGALFLYIPSYDTTQIQQCTIILTNCTKYRSVGGPRAGLSIITGAMMSSAEASWRHIFLPCRC